MEKLKPFDQDGRMRPQDQAKIEAIGAFGNIAGPLGQLRNEW